MRNAMLQATTIHRSRVLMRCSAFALGLAMLLNSGCKSVAPTIPIGAWHGEGTLVYLMMPESNKDEAPQHITRTYQTRMEIAPREVDGHKVIGLEILSERGELPDMDDRTHLEAILADVGPDSENAQRYRIVNMQLNADPNEPLTWKDEEQFPTAATLVNGDSVSLHLQYMENFVDVLRFDGDSVTKNGTYYDEKGGIIHWAETLKRE